MNFKFYKSFLDRLDLYFFLFLEEQKQLLVPSEYMAVETTNIYLLVQLLDHFNSIFKPLTVFFSHPQTPLRVGPTP